MSTQQTASSKKPIICSACEATFHGWEPFFHHASTKHNKDSVSCGWCGFFYAGKNLKKHMMSTHAGTKKKNRPRTPQPHPHPQPQPIFSQPPMDQARFYTTNYATNGMTSGRPHHAQPTMLSSNLNASATSASFQRPPPPPHPMSFPTPPQNMLSRQIPPWRGLPLQPIVPPVVPPPPQPVPQPALTEDDAACVLLALKDPARANGKLSKRKVHDVTVKCPDCETTMGASKSDVSVSCYVCKHSYKVGPNTIAVRKVVAQSGECKANGESTMRVNVVEMCSRLGGHVRVSVADILNDHEIQELRAIERSFEKKSAGELRGIALGMLKASFVERRRRGTDPRLVEIEARERDLTRKLSETEEERKSVCAELDEAKEEWKRARVCGVKRRLEGGEGVSAKKMRMSDHTAVRVGSNGVSNGNGHCNGNGNREDVKMAEIVGEGVFGRANKTSRVSERDLLAYRSEGDAVMAQWVLKARRAVFSLERNEKASALRSPIGNGKDGMYLGRLLALCEKMKSIWAIEDALEKLWSAGRYLCSIERMRRDDLSSVRLEMRRKLRQIMGDAEEWSAPVVGKFFEHLKLAEVDTVIANVIRGNVTGAMLVGIGSEFGGLMRYADQLGLSYENAVVCHASVRKFLDEPKNERMLVWTTGNNVGKLKTTPGRVGVMDGQSGA